MADLKKKRSHGRQSSTASTEEDGQYKIHGSDDFDKAVIQIQRKLDLISHEYKKQDNFNPLEHVIDIMKASNNKERKKELIMNCKAMDKSMETIVKGIFLLKEKRQRIDSL